MATMRYPGGDRNHIHAIAGRNQPRQNKNAVVNEDVVRRRRATDAYNAIPKKLSGHQPHGGIDAATRSPAATGDITFRITKQMLRE
jgi:hypothetical protein